MPTNPFQLLIVQPIFNVLMFVYNFIGDFGVAIIVLTIIIRLLLWPLVRRQLHQTKLMRSIQPELKKIKKKAGGNKMLESTMMMELYREKGIKMGASFWPLLIQLPIFIAIFQVIRIIAIHHDKIEGYTYGFLKGLNRTSDVLANPDTFGQHFLGLVDLSRSGLGNGIYIPAIILALFAAGFQYIQSKQTMPNQEKKRRLRDIMREAADGKEVDQSEMMASSMGGMMKFFPIMTFFIGVSFPAALTLYWATQSGVAVLQQKYVLDKDLGEMEKIASTTTSKRAKNVREAVVVKQPNGAAAKTAKRSNDKASSSSKRGTVVRRIKAK